MRQKSLIGMLMLLSFAGISLEASSEDVRKSYRLRVASALGEMLVRSSSELSENKLAAIAWHFRNAAHLAEAFAHREGVKVQRPTLPARVELYASPADLSKSTGLPQYERLGEVVARIDLRQGIVHLGRGSIEDLYVELGKWLYYEPGYRWGLVEASDLRHLALAEKFAAFCLDSKNWSEVGGSNSALR